MIIFLLKGIWRDKSRSVLPIIIIALGVALTIFLSGYLKGVMGDMINQNARFETGHVKITTNAYLEYQDQMPLDLALLGVGDLEDSLKRLYPNIEWVKRIRFGGLLDVANEIGETKGQQAASGLALELFSEKSGEIERLDLNSSLVKGRLPQKASEVLVSNEFFDKVGLGLQEELTYFGSTMNRSLALQNFKIVGTIRFGISMMDQGAIIMDITDAQKLLDMGDGATEILGYFEDQQYDDPRATRLTRNFNKKFTKKDDEFSPTMLALKQQNNLDDMLSYVNVASGLFVGIFVLAMSVVLWNTGLIAGLRRYQEYGIRLALGESKGDLYKSMIYEALLIGTLGSVAGTVIGLGITYYMQEVGIDLGQFIENSSVMMPSKLRAKITPELFFIGFIPGLLAMTLGNMLAGIGIFKRETARLFKELEV